MDWFVEEHHTEARDDRVETLALEWIPLRVAKNEMSRRAFSFGAFSFSTGEGEKFNGGAVYLYHASALGGATMERLQMERRSTTGGHESAGATAPSTRW